MAHFTQSGCYEDFSGVSMTVLRDVKVPTNSLDLPGYGPSQNIFRVDEDLKLHVTMTSGKWFSNLVHLLYVHNTRA